MQKEIGLEKQPTGQVASGVIGVDLHADIRDIQVILQIGNGHGDMQG